MVDFYRDHNRLDFLNGSCTLQDSSEHMQSLNLISSQVLHEILWGKKTLGVEDLLGCTREAVQLLRLGEGYFAIIVL